MRYKTKKWIILLVTIVILIAVYFLLKNVSPDCIEGWSLALPLPVFTFIIALMDGFNPCNLFVLTLLVSLMLAESHSRKKIFVVGFSFIVVIYLFYFFFMSAWLNIFKYIGFVNPLRITIALVAIIAGLINCKELFFYRKGITLMVQTAHIGPLKRRINKIAELMKQGSLPALIGSAVVLAVFASLVELPCTAGFPIIYTGVLTGVYLQSSLGYYLYLALYNLIYVLPLIVIIIILGFTFKGRTIKPRTMGLIKFIGGAIMLLLGLILLVSPALIGL